MTDLPLHTQQSSASKESLRKLLQLAIDDLPMRDPRALAAELLMQLAAWRSSHYPR